MSARWKGPSRDHRAAADSGAEAIRFSTPMTDAPNTRRKAGENERSGASRQKTGGFAGTDSGDPRPRGGPLHRSAAKRFSLWTAQSRSRRRLRRLTDAAYPLRVRPVSLLARQKRNGGCNGPAIIIAESPGRQVAAPTPLRRRAPGGSRFGGVPQSSHSPLWASHHAGNAGSFGERVGLIGWAKRVVSFFLALNGWIKSTPLQFPK